MRLVSFPMVDRKTIYRLSRSQSFLWKVVIGIALAGALIAYAVSPEEDLTFDRLLEQAESWSGGALSPEGSGPEEELRKPAPDLGEVLFSLPPVEFLGPADWTKLRGLVASSALPSGDKVLLDALIDSLLSAEGNLQALAEAKGLGRWTELSPSNRGEAVQPTVAFQQVLDERRGERYTALAEAVFYRNFNQLAKAAEAFEREGRFPDAENARRMAILAYAAVEADEALRRLLDDPAFAELFTARDRLRLAEAEFNYWEMLIYMWPAQMIGIPFGFVFLALFAGLIWFLFLIKALRLKPHVVSRLALCLSAVVFGAASTVPTLVFAYYQEHEWGLVDGTNFMGDVLYYTLGVGFREELMKLLLFTPLVPFLLRRKNQLEILIVAGCVGLGFAAEENINYFAGVNAIPVAPRFLTANFFHIAMTGLIGLSFCRIFLHWPNGINEFLTVFPVIVLAHGLYNSFLAVPELNDGGLISTIILILVVYQFFRELNGMRMIGGDVLSLTSVLVVGFALVMSVTLIYVGSFAGLESAIEQQAGALLSSVVLIVLFIRESREDFGP